VTQAGKRYGKDAADVYVREERDRIEGPAIEQGSQEKH